jgi:hypothetical protein
VDIIDRLRPLPWELWIALALTIGLTLFLVLSRVADAEEEGRSRRFAEMQSRRKSRAASSSGNRILISDAESLTRAVTGELLECSLSSISLRVADAQERGTMLSWRPADAPSNLGWAVVEVKDAKPDGSYCKLSCRFVRTPPWVTRFLASAPAAADPTLL